MLLLTGCTVNYNLEINDKAISENIIGNISRNEFDDITDEYADHNIYWLLHDKQPALFDGSTFYEQNINENNEMIDFDYKYTYNNNFGESNILNRCFENKIFEETEDLYVIHLYGDFYCQYNDKIDVNVKTNLTVIDNNANIVDGNNYKWVLEDNSNNVDIFLTISKNIGTINDKEKSIFTPYRIITLIILIVLVIVSLFIYKKKNSKK